MVDQLQGRYSDNTGIGGDPASLPSNSGVPARSARGDGLRLLLLDSYGLFRASLARFLSSEPGLNVAGECGTSDEGRDLLIREEMQGPGVDLVLLDFEIDGESAGDFITAARQAGYRGQFLIVAGSADARKAAAALKLGASGIFLKSDAPERLIQAIRLVGNDGVWIDKGIIRRIAEQFSEAASGITHHRAPTSLEGLEKDVLLGIVEGHTNRRIGEMIGLTESRVKNIVQRLFGRAGVKTRGQLVRAALEGSLRVDRTADRLPGVEVPSTRH